MKPFKRACLATLAALPIASVSYFANWKLLSSSSSSEKTVSMNMRSALRSIVSLFSFGLRNRAETLGQTSLTLDEAREIFRELSLEDAQGDLADRKFQEAIEILIINEKIKVNSNILIAGNDSGLIPK